MHLLRLLLFAVTATLTTSKPNPKPFPRTCYGTLADQGERLNVVDIAEIANRLRALHQRRVGENCAPLLKMRYVKEGDRCPKWPIAMEGNVIATAELRGTKDFAVTLNDVANTIDPGPDADTDAVLQSLMYCGPQGGTMGVLRSKYPFDNNTAPQDVYTAANEIVISLSHNPFFWGQTTCGTPKALEQARYDVP